MIYARQIVKIIGTEQYGVIARINKEGSFGIFDLEEPHKYYQGYFTEEQLENTGSFFKKLPDAPKYRLGDQVMVSSTEDGDIIVEIGNINRIYHDYIIRKWIYAVSHQDRITVYEEQDICVI